MKQVSDDERTDSKNKRSAAGDPHAPLDDYSIISGEDILSRQDVDPALNAKMHLVNNVREFSVHQVFRHID